MDFDHINALALAQGDQLLRAWFPAGRRSGREFLLGSLDGSPGKSLSINLHTGVWCDFATGDKGKGLIDLLARKERVPHRDAAVRLLALLGRPTSAPTARPPTKPKPLLPAGFGHGSIADLNELRIRRHLPAWAGLDQAQRDGVLGFGWAHDDNHRVRIWCLTDPERRTAQWRRLDGLAWQNLPGKPKARTAVARPGEAAWPIGITLAQEAALILLCEGGPDFLAAYTLRWLHAQHNDEPPGRVAITTLFGAAQRIHPDSAAHWRGKHVRLVYHDDEPGRAACVRHAHELRAFGARHIDAFRVSGLTLTAEGKDLNDCISPDLDHPHHPSLLQLFHL